MFRINTNIHKQVSEPNIHKQVTGKYSRQWLELFNSFRQLASGPSDIADEMNEVNAPHEMNKQENTATESFGETKPRNNVYSPEKRDSQVWRCETRLHL
jgi:hypothetical protein